MKYEKIIYGLSAIVIIIGAMMKILHIPYSSLVLLSGVMVSSVFQTWHIAELKKRIEELESK